MENILIIIADYSDYDGSGVIFLHGNGNYSVYEGNNYQTLLMLGFNIIKADTILPLEYYDVESIVEFANLGFRKYEKIDDPIEFFDRMVNKFYELQDKLVEG